MKNDKCKSSHGGSSDPEPGCNPDGTATKPRSLDAAGKASLLDQPSFRAAFPGPSATLPPAATGNAVQQGTAAAEHDPLADDDLLTPQLDAWLGTNMFVRGNG